MRLKLAMCAAMTLGLWACAERVVDPTADLAGKCADERLAATQRADACTALLDMPELEATLRVEALAHRGELRRLDGKPTEALADFNAALALAPEQSAAQLGRAAILIESGQLEAALPLVESVVERGEIPARARFLRGRLRLRWGDAGGALEDFSAALEADPRMTEALAQRALTKQLFEDYPGAQADFDAALAADRANAAAYAGRCWNRLYLGEEAGPARADAESAIRVDPTLASAQLCLGMAALKQQQWDLARGAYAAAVALEPGNPEAIFGRGLASIRQGNRREGNDDIDRAQQFNSRVGDRFRQVGVRT